MDSNNPFSSSQRTGALPVTAAAARFASVRPPVPAVISSSASSVMVVGVGAGGGAADVANPFGVPRSAPTTGPATLASLIVEWCAAAGPTLYTGAAGAGGDASDSGSDAIPPTTAFPLPLRFLRFCSRVPPAVPPTSLSAGSSIPMELEEALAATATRRFTAVAARVPPAAQCLATGLVMGGALAPRDVALVRCRAASLAALRKYTSLIAESGVVLRALAAEGGPDAAAAAVHWLVIVADALRGAGLWREAVFVSSALVKALRTHLTNTKETEIKATWTPAPTRIQCSQSWLAAPGFLPESEVVGPSPPPDIGVFIDAALALVTLEGRSFYTTAATPPDTISKGSRAMTRALVAIAGIASGALGDAGHAVGAANAATDAAAAAGEALAAATTEGAAPVAKISDCGSGGGGAAKTGLPEWIAAGCALLGVARTHRAAARDAEAAEALHALFGIPAWHAAGDLLIAAAAGTVGVNDVAALSPATAYAVGVLGAVRGGEALAVGRFAEALQLFEAAALALVRRFLPTGGGESGGVGVGGGVGGGAGGGGSVAAAAAAASATSSLAAASTCCAPADGGASLLQPHVGALATVAVPSSFLPDPLELLGEVLLGTAEALRRLPPGVANPGAPPVAVAAGLLEAAVRAAPCAMLRAPLVVALTGLYDAGRDPVSAAAAKRLLAGVAHAYGLTHLETASFRLPAL